MEVYYFCHSHQHMLSWFSRLEAHVLVRQFQDSWTTSSHSSVYFTMLRDCLVDNWPSISFDTSSDPLASDVPITSSTSNSEVLHFTVHHVDTARTFCAMRCELWTKDETATSWRTMNDHFQIASSDIITTGRFGNGRSWFSHLEWSLLEPSRSIFSVKLKARCSQFNEDDTLWCSEL